jgi:hypothetical protein
MRIDVTGRQTWLTDPEELARGQASAIPWDAGAADVRPKIVHLTGCLRTDATDQCGATRTVATHSLLVRGYELRRQQIESSFCFGGKSGPGRRIGAAGSAASAIKIDQ